MKTAKLADMKKGWFIGNFEPTLLSTEHLEVGVKNYTAGDKEPGHFHKVATEITLIISGKVEINGCEYTSGDLVILEPGEHSYFVALTDAVTTVVKYPCVLEDKYLL